MKHTIVIKRPGEPAEVAMYDGIYRRDLTPLLGKKITPSYCHINNQDDVLRLCFVCDEDGCFKDIPENFYLITSSRFGNHLEVIKGTVVFFKYIYEPYCGEEIYDYRLFPLNDSDLAMIEYLLSDEYQSKAKGLRP